MVNGVTDGREKKRRKGRTGERGEMYNFKSFGRNLFRVRCKVRVGVDTVICGDLDTVCENQMSYYVGLPT